MSEDATPIQEGEVCCICDCQATRQNVWTGLLFCDKPECWTEYVKRMQHPEDKRLMDMIRATGR